jgi:signal peptidase I
MTKKNTLTTEPVLTAAAPDPEPAPKAVEETPFEAVASICSVLVVGLFILTFLGQNFVIPSGSMEDTLLVGDHLLVDRITLAPPAKWMPLVHYREPKRGDIIVFIKPVADEVNGEPQYLYLVKRLVGLPGDHIRLRDGEVYINGQAQPLASTAHQATADGGLDRIFLDEFPAVAPVSEPGNRFPNPGKSTFPTTFKTVTWSCRRANIS